MNNEEEEYTAKLVKQYLDRWCALHSAAELALYFLKKTNGPFPTYEKMKINVKQSISKDLSVLRLLQFNSVVPGLFILKWIIDFGKVVLVIDMPENIEDVLNAYIQTN
jgi:hypothetical protein